MGFSGHGFRSMRGCLGPINQNGRNARRNILRRGFLFESTLLSVDAIFYRISSLVPGIGGPVVEVGQQAQLLCNDSLNLQNY